MTAKYQAALCIAVKVLAYKVRPEERLHCFV